MRQPSALNRTSFSRFRACVTGLALLGSLGLVGCGGSKAEARLAEVT